MQPDDYVTIGSNLINVVPLPNVYVIANYKETQLTRVKPGQPVDLTVDSFPHERLHGYVERIAPASGSQFALLPPDNATGNFTKVVQRIPVRIALDADQNTRIELRPGMSVIPTIATRSSNASREAAATSIHKTNSGASCHVKSQPFSLDIRAADLARSI